jgi:excisionase family DNA binding protein
VDDLDAEIARLQRERERRRREQERTQAGKPSTEKVWMSREEAAEYLGVSLNTVVRLMKQPGFPVSRLSPSGGRATPRINRQDLDAWMRAQELKATDPPPPPRRRGRPPKR